MGTFTEMIDGYSFYNSFSSCRMFCKRDIERYVGCCFGLFILTFSYLQVLFIDIILTRNIALLKLNHNIIILQEDYIYVVVQMTPNVLVTFSQIISPAFDLLNLCHTDHNCGKAMR